MKYEKIIKKKLKEAPAPLPFAHALGRGLRLRPCMHCRARVYLRLHQRRRKKLRRQLLLLLLLLLLMERRWHAR